MLRSFCKSIYKDIARLFHQRNVPIGGILMLHRVDTPDSEGIWYNQHLKLSPHTIAEMVEYARKHDCHFVSIDMMMEAIKKKKKVRRCIVVTLDDGYRDNYENGSSLFRQLDIPYTIYVCTKMVKGEMLYWWEILEQLVLSQKEVKLSNGRIFDCSTKEKKEKAFLDIREIILKLPQDSLKSRLQTLFADDHIDWSYGNDHLGLTWAQLRDLKNEKLATIGNHTYSHNAFKGCTDEAICSDIQLAAKEMWDNCQIEMNHFAFPFGEATAVSEQNVQLIKHIGFKTSATTNDGLVCYGTDLLELPRLFVTERNWKQTIDRIIENC